MTRTERQHAPVPILHGQPSTPPSPLPSVPSGLWRIPEHVWSEQTRKRVAAGLLKLVVDFSHAARVRREDGGMDDLQKRHRQELEPILLLDDPRTPLSAYHDMPSAIFRDAPEDEFELRREVTMLCTRLEQAGKNPLEAPSAVGAAKKPRKGKASA